MALPLTLRTCGGALRGGGPHMRRTLILAVGSVIAMANTGCLINQYSGDPVVRTDQLLNQSEDLRQLGQEWRRIWFNDMPSHMTPERVHGGIIP